LGDGDEPRWRVREERGGGIGSERFGSWLDGGCVVCGRELRLWGRVSNNWWYRGRDGFANTVDRKLAVSVIWRNFRKGMLISVHRLIAGLVRKAPVAILSAEFCTGSRRFSWEEGASP